MGLKEKKGNTWIECAKDHFGIRTGGHKAEGNANKSQGAASWSVCLAKAENTGSMNEGIQATLLPVPGCWDKAVEGWESGKKELSRPDLVPYLYPFILGRKVYMCKQEVILQRYTEWPIPERRKRKQEFSIVRVRTENRHGRKGIWKGSWI